LIEPFLLPVEQLPDRILLPVERRDVAAVRMEQESRIENRIDQKRPPGDPKHPTEQGVEDRIAFDFVVTQHHGGCKKEEKGDRENEPEKERNQRRSKHEIRHIKQGGCKNAQRGMGEARFHGTRKNPGRGEPGNFMCCPIIVATRILSRSSFVGGATFGTANESD